MSYYQRHFFVCTNQRANGEACCADLGAQSAMLNPQFGGILG